MDKKILCAMLDCSRDGVMRTEELKKFILILKKAGYNSVGLYMEDTYEITAEPYFGYLRGRYTQSELKEINDFGKEHGVTVIPYVQTLAHLGTIFNWQTFRNRVWDCQDIMCIENPETYKLIDEMFASLRKCFDGEYINIGMDEANLVGCGNYRWTYGYDGDRVNLIYKHLLKVIDIAKKYAFKPIMWSDMFWRVENKNLKEFIPKDVILCHWDYYRDKKKLIDNDLKKHFAVTDKVAFAGGAWTWSGFAPQNRWSIKSMKEAMKSCREYGVNNVTITMWGDFGSECSFYSVLPSLFYCAEKYLYDTKDVDIKVKFEKLFGIKFNDFLALDEPNYIKNNDSLTGNPSKYGLFNDPLYGKFDYHISDGDGNEFKRITKKIARVEKRAGEYAYLFENMKRLSKAMEIKYDLGVKTRAAYAEKNREQLAYIADKLYPECIRRVDSFYESFKSVWEKEKKPFGFEVHDIRFGGLVRRLNHCRKTIKDYLSGKIEKIEELEMQLLSFDGSTEKSAGFNVQNYVDIVTANIL